MPNYAIIQVDPLPAVGGQPKTATVALVNAVSDQAAMDAYSASTGVTAPQVAQIAPASAFVRWTTTSTITRTSVSG